jgi:hypothetical protein
MKRRFMTTHYAEELTRTAGCACGRAFASVPILRADVPAMTLSVSSQAQHLIRDQ